MPTLDTLQQQPESQQLEGPGTQILAQSQKEEEAGTGDEDNDIEDEDEEEETLLVTRKAVVSTPSPQACKQKLDTKHEAPFPPPTSMDCQLCAYPTPCSF